VRHARFVRVDGELRPNDRPLFLIVENETKDARFDAILLDIEVSRSVKHLAKSKAGLMSHIAGFVQGTIAPLSFVHDVLFPYVVVHNDDVSPFAVSDGFRLFCCVCSYVRKHLHAYLIAHWNEEETQSDLTLLCEDMRHEADPRFASLAKVRELNAFGSI